MSLRRLPFGVFMYLVGGILFGFGMGFGASSVPGVATVVITGLGALAISAGYFIFRPLMREAKAQLLGKKGDDQAAAKSAVGAQ
ncbi:MAG: hypothetical protein I4O49_19560 [Janthinobacterium lividum]|jgi:hypothetical protein|uniref:hypothetical protein n=1 Tax=Ralstonia sp. OTU4908 TaxID=3043851 RepID=UPI00313DC8D3|nr:hypothetical protein [Janthinobacterium lividum]